METYFSNEWFHNGKLPDRVECALIEINGLDYTKFKLFHHSILFRASVSSLDQFKLVSLGKNEELLRTMLLSGDAGNEFDFPFITKILYHPGDRRVASDIIVKPEVSHPDGHYVYIFVFAGCCWMYYASKTGANNLTPHVFGTTGILYLAEENIYNNPRIAEFARNYRAKMGSDDNLAT